MMYEPEYTREFYNVYGEKEWARLEVRPYGRLQAIIHEDFINRYIRPGMRLLDAGSGPGRFSIIAAKNACKVTILDISDIQLELAEKKINEAGLRGFVERFLREDIATLSGLADNCFDITLCFGGALSYVCEKRFAAARELVRVTKPGGVILVSVMSLAGSALSSVTIPSLPMLENPETEVSGIPPLFPVIETGDLPGFPSKSGMDHAPMHLYVADELGKLFGGCTVLEIAGSNVTFREHSQSGEKIAESPKAWDTLVKLEKKLNHDPGLVNSGSHIIVAVRKNETEPFSQGRLSNKIDING